MRPKITPTKRSNTRRREKGFSLIELMITLIIISILAAIAIPAYQDYSRNAIRAEAHAALEKIAALQERFFTNANRYASTAGDLGLNAIESESGHWAISMSALDGGAAFSLSAQTAGGYSDPDCTSISLGSSGQRVAEPVAHTDLCWLRD